VPRVLSETVALLIVDDITDTEDAGVCGQLEGGIDADEAMLGEYVLAERL
jgi:hypothetical protein